MALAGVSYLIRIWEFVLILDSIELDSMTRNFSCVLSLLFLGIFSSNAQHINWAKVLDSKSPNSASPHEVSVLRTDDSFFYSFGKSALGVELDNVSHISVDSGYFLAKHDLTGAVIWKSRIRPPRYTTFRPGGMVMNSSHELIVAGGFDRNLIFNPGQGNSIKLDIAQYSSPLVDPGSGWFPFLAKYSPDGICIKAKILATRPSPDLTPIQPVFDIAIDHSDNVYVIGQYYSAAVFEQGGNPQVLATNNVGFSYFLAKYDASLSLVWLKNITTDGTGAFSPKNGVLRISADGTLYLGGSFSGAAIFGSINSQPFKLASYQSGSSIKDEISPFLAAYDLNGNFKWAKLIVTPRTFTSSSGSFINGIDLDNNGDAYVVGSLSAMGGTFDLGGANEVSQFSMGAFIAKISKNGQFLWKNLTLPLGPGNDLYIAGRVIDCDGQGNCTMAGEFNATKISFGADQQVFTPIATATSLYLAEFDATGAFLRAIHFNHNSNHASTGLRANFVSAVCKVSEEVIVAGQFVETLNLAQGADNSIALSLVPPITDLSQSDLFLASITMHPVQQITAVTEIQSGIEVFPNPAQHIVNIRNLSEGDRFTIVDIMGRTLAENYAGSPEAQIDIRQYPDGLYVLTVWRGGEAFNVRFIKL